VVLNQFGVSFFKRVKFRYFGIRRRYSQVPDRGCSELKPSKKKIETKRSKQKIETKTSKQKIETKASKQKIETKTSE